MRRTVVALALVIAAVAVPGSAWFLTGRREALRTADALRREPVEAVRRELNRHADRVSVRLGSIMKAENLRPFYHYQSLFHDPRGAHEGYSVTPSPIADEPEDPWIRAHFQIDPQGHLSLPTVNEEICNLNAPDVLVSQQPILQELQAAARDWWEEAKSWPASDAQGYRTKKVPASLLQGGTPSAPDEDQPSDEGRVELMEGTAWVQNALASQVYLGVKGGNAQYPITPSGIEGPVVIRVGELTWQSVAIGDQPALAAVRRVVTPTGTTTQGFQISTEALVGSLSPAPPATGLSFRPGPPELPTHVSVPIAGIPWHLESALSAREVEAAERKASAVVASFHRTFAGGALLALVASMALVGLVHQSERMARQRSLFAASAAHELRTPLAGLRLYGEMLADGMGDPKRAREYARRIALEADRLGRLVGNVLGFSKLERQNLRVHPRPGDLGAAVSGWLTQLRPAVEASGADLDGLIDPAPEVSFDPDATLQILQNLVDNAEKHSRSSSDRRIAVSVAPVNGSVVLAVTDQGPGIPDSVRARLFQPFARDPSPDAPAGLGLGLVLVRALSEAQGARVSFDDNPGPGTTFQVTFPINPPSAS